MLIRRKAFEDVRGFDERIFFMYCEDVDLSWKLWLRGWQCIYVREAVIQHFTQDLLPGKRRTIFLALARFPGVDIWKAFGNYARQAKVRHSEVKDTEDKIKLRKTNCANTRNH